MKLSTFAVIQKLVYVYTFKNLIFHHVLLKNLVKVKTQIPELLIYNFNIFLPFFFLFHMTKIIILKTRDSPEYMLSILH